MFPVMEPQQLCAIEPKGPMKPQGSINPRRATCQLVSTGSNGTTCIGFEPLGPLSSLKEGFTVDFNSKLSQTESNYWKITHHGHTRVLSISREKKRCKMNKKAKKNKKYLRCLEKLRKRKLFLLSCNLKPWKRSFTSCLTQIDLGWDWITYDEIKTA